MSLLWQNEESLPDRRRRTIEAVLAAAAAAVVGGEKYEKIVRGTVSLEA